MYASTGDERLKEKATAVVAGLVFTGHDPLAGINAGFIALAVNAALAVGISLALGKRKALSL